jgi:hypothetical protein
VVKQDLGYYLCQSALKTAIFFKREKDFSNNYSISSSIPYQHYPYTGIVDQKYDSCGRKTVYRKGTIGNRSGLH